MRFIIIFLIFFSLTSYSQKIALCEKHKNIAKKYIDLQTKICSGYCFDKHHRLYYNNQFEIHIDEKEREISQIEINLKNPFKGSLYPLSYSFIYDNNLIVLFDPGNFMCLNLYSLKRNIDLEMQLNYVEFNYSWKINNKIIAKNEDGLKCFENGKWMPYYGISIKDNEPKIFEDDSYIAYMKCNGEFGGVIYFISKGNEKVYWKTATCANSVFLENNRYYILSNLGHGFGRSDMIQIKDPSLFWNNKYKAKKYERRIITNPDSILNYQKRDNEIKILDSINGQKYKEFISKGRGNVFNDFDYHGIQVFSTFKLNKERYFICYWSECTFLAKIENGEILIQDILFDNFYTHDPITTQIDKNLVLINLDFYSKGGDREVSCILIDENKIIKFNWE